MLITESRLRKIIHDEIHEMYCRKSYKNYTFINELGTSESQYDSYAKGIIKDLPSDNKNSPTVGDTLPPDHWAQYVNLLNPIDAYKNYTEKKAIASASKELAAELGKIPIIGSAGIFAGAIFDTIDGNYQAASIKFTKAIVDTVITYYCGKFITKYLTTDVFLTADRTLRAVIMASAFSDGVTDWITTNTAAAITDMLNNGEINQELYDAVSAKLTPDVIKPILAARTESVMNSAA